MNQDQIIRDILLRSAGVNPAQHSIERKIHDLQTIVLDDLMKAANDVELRQYLDEARLCSVLAGLQFICSDLRESRLKVTSEAAE